MAWTIRDIVRKPLGGKNSFVRQALPYAAAGVAGYGLLTGLGPLGALGGTGGVAGGANAAGKLALTGGLLGAGATIYGSNVNAKALGQAGEMQLEGTREAIAAQQQAMEEQRALYEPYRQLGLEALPKLRESLTSTPQDSPLYKWQLEKGLEQLRGRNASYRGGYLKQLESDYVSRLNAEETDKQYGRIRDIAGLGAGITGQQAGAEQQYGGALANLQYQGGMGQANIASERGQARNSMYQTLGQGIMGGTQGYLNYLQGQNTNQTLQQQLALMQGGGGNQNIDLTNQNQLPYNLYLNRYGGR